MKLYMVSELSISCLLFTLIPPPMVNVRAVRILLECILVCVFVCLEIDPANEVVFGVFSAKSKSKKQMGLQLHQ